MMSTIVRLYRILRKEALTYQALNAFVADAKDLKERRNNILTEYQKRDLQTYIEYLSSTIADISKCIGPLSTVAKGKYYEFK